MPSLHASRPQVWLIAVLLLGLTYAWAGNDLTSSTLLSGERASSQTLSEEQRAEAWGLRTEDWARYRQLQQGPLGIYSPNLDPLTALGIEARNDEERQRYAELQVHAESARVNKELAYQRAYDQAWQRLYPDLQPVNLSSTASQTTKRLALFIKGNCEPCNRQARQLLTAGQAFDLYMVDSNNDDARLRQWAKRIALNPASVRERRITLNHDAGRWSSLGVTGGLPALVREVNGQWQRQ